MENSEFPGEVLSIDLNITVIDDGMFVNYLQQKMLLLAFKTNLDIEIG